MAKTSALRGAPGALSRNSDRGALCISIVGGGFSGAAAAAALLRAIDEPFALTIIDEQGFASGGLAYGEATMGERLNVRARSLSLLAGARGDFATWLAARHAGPGRRIDIDASLLFAPRQLFGDYARERLDAEIARRPDVRVEFIRARAIDAAPHGASIRLGLSTGGTIDAHALIVATGYGFRERARRFGANPFLTAEIKAARAAARIALVGSGLTAVDALLSLRRAGATGSISIISRRARLPLAHDETAGLPESWSGPIPSAASALMRAVRIGTARAMQDGHCWQSLVDGLRPEVSCIWRTLPLESQRRFLRHARAHWDAHRHRLAPDIARQVALELRLKRTRLIAARAIVSGASRGAGLAIQRRSAAAPERLDVDVAIDCSGWTPDLSNPLIARLIAAGLAQTDAHGLGLDVAPDGRLKSRRAGAPIHALGPLGIGSLFEITAAPEIAEQARDAAARIARERKIGAIGCVGDMPAG